MADFAGLRPQRRADSERKFSTFIYSPIPLPPLVLYTAASMVHFHYGLAVLDRLLSTPPHGDAVTNPSLPHTANSADGTFTRLNTGFSGAPLSPIFQGQSPNLQFRPGHSHSAENTPINLRTIRGESLF